MNQRSVNASAARAPQGLDRTIWYAPELGITYLRNPKVACSSIQKSIWLAVDPDSYTGNPHSRAVGPFNRNLVAAVRDPARFESATLFSAVRNPFSRFLSAYLDKTGGTADREVWKGIADRLGFGYAERPSINEVLRRLVSDPHPESVDHHLRPQAYNLLHSLVVPDFIGHFERFEEVEQFLAKHGCQVEKHAPHATDAGKEVASRFDSEAIELVTEYYGVDFDLYGYSRAPSELAPVRVVGPSPSGKDKLSSELRQRVRGVS